MSKYWNEARLNIVRSLAREGMTAAQIGEHFGRSRAAVSEQCRRHDISVMYSKGMTWTEAQKAELKRMAAEGFTRPEAAAALNRSVSGVETKAKNMGLKFRNCNQYTQRNPVKKKVVPTKRRRCLTGGMHWFDAPIDENGKPLRYSCAEHQAQANRYDAGL